MKSNIREIVISALSVALCTTLMILTGVLSVAAYIMPMVAGLLISIIQIELNSKRASQIFIATSILSFIFCPDKESFIIFILFMGIYPIVKNRLDRISNLLLRFLCKALISLIASSLIFVIFTYILMIPEDFFNLFGIPVKLLTILSMCASFLLYDMAINNFNKFYIRKLQILVRNNILNKMS